MPLPTASSPIGLDICGSFACAVQVSRSGRGSQVVHAAALPRREAALPLEAEEATLIAELLDRHGFRGRRVVLAMPPESLFVDVVDLRGEGGDETRESVARHLARVHRQRADKLECAWWAAPEGRAGRGRAMAVGCLREQCEAMLDAVESAGLSPVAVDARSCALARACAPLAAPEGDFTAVIELGWSSAMLVILLDGTIAFERLLSDCGINRVHGTLVNRLGLEPDLAGHILGEIGLRGDRALATEGGLLEAARGQIEDHIDRLLRELRLSLAYVAQEYPQRSIEHLLVTGEAARIPDLAEPLAEELGAPVRIIAPSDVAAVAPSLGDRCAHPRLIAAMGLALHPGDA